MDSPLWLSNLLDYSVQIALLAIVGGVLPAVFRLRLPKACLAYWQTLLAVCLLWPLLEPWKQARLPLGRVSFGIIRSQAVSASPGASPIRLHQIIALVLLVGFGARLIWLIAGLCRLRRYRRRATLLVKLPQAVHELQCRLQVHPAFYLSRELDGPVTYGRIRPVVLFHARFTRMSAECQRAVACHELLHARRGDWFFNLIEEMLRAALWFHPGIAWIVGRIRLTREQVVDREVVEITGARRPYLEALLEIAAAGVSHRMAPAPPFSGEVHLRQRVGLMLKEVSMSRPRLITSSIATACALFSAAWLAGWSFPLQTPPHEPAISATPMDSIDAPPPESGQGNTGNGQKAAPQPIHTVRPEYPPLARFARLQGVVGLRVNIDEKGQVQEIAVISGHPLLVKAAIDAVRQWRYAESPLLPAVTEVSLRFQPPQGKESGGEGAPSAKSKGAERTQEVLKLVHGVNPAYPEEARQLHLEGNVTLDATVNERGEVIHLRVVDGPPLLVKPALDAVKQWKYEPTSKAPVHTTVTLNFTLANSPGQSSKPRTEQSEPLTLLSQGHAAIPSDPKCQDEGDVEVQVTVGKKGEVLEAKALSGPECLKNDVVRWVRTFHYSPPAQPPATTLFSFGMAKPEGAEPRSTETASPAGSKVVKAPLEVQEGVSPPIPIFKPEPPYTDEARKAGVQGTAAFTVIVDTQGNVTDVRAASEPLGKGLDDSAFKTLATWKFKPALRGGKPVPVKVTIEIAFRLYKKKPA
jgi:TonB family protein